MKKIIHGGDIYSHLEQSTDKEQSLIDFSANINPLGLPEGVRVSIIESLDKCANYPDPLCRNLKNALSEKYSISQNNVILGNGASDLIYRLVLAKKPKKAMVLAPTFSEYEQALNAVGCQVATHLLTQERMFTLDNNFPNILDGSLDMLFICNPNNPTGLLVEKNLMVEVLDKCSRYNILLIIDECFIDFVKEPGRFTLKSMIQEKKNLFILCAFTKTYAMPGLRLGYGLCNDEELLEKMYAIWQPWNVSLVAQLAGLQALKEDDYLEKSRLIVLNEQIFLKEKLSNFGFEVYPSESNYIFFRIPLEKTYEYIDSFESDLANEGILVRSCANFTGLDNSYFRIAVRTREENEMLIDAIKKREDEWQKQ